MDGSMKPEVYESALLILKRMKEMEIDEAKKRSEDAGPSTAEPTRPNESLLYVLRRRVGIR